MVIDDEPAICRLIEYQLADAGYQVTSYQRGYDALLRLAYEQPELILLDVMMPEISGWDLCRQIRASSSVPIIMLTAKCGDDDVVTGLQQGADDYVGKPFSAQQLIARIEAVLRRAQDRRSRHGPPAPAQLTPATGLPVVAPAPAPAPLASAGLPARPPRLGPALAEARRQRRLSLHDAGEGCGVRWEFLQAIEQEQFSYVPRSELRHALRSYSAFLNLDLTPYVGHGRSREASNPGALSLTVGVVVVVAVALVLIILAL